MLIRTEAGQQAVVSSISDPQFSFYSVRDLVRTEPELDLLCRSLDRDYKLFSYLLEHAVGLKATSIEDRLLVLDYRVMQVWYRLTKTAAPDQARNALVEMATVLSLLVGKMGERAAAQSQA